MISGVGFRLSRGLNIPVLTVKSFPLDDTVFALVRGKAALAIVATDKITIRGVLDARGFDLTGNLCSSTSTDLNTAVGPSGGNGVDVAGGGSGDFGSQAETAASVTPTLSRAKADSRWCSRAR